MYPFSYWFCLSHFLSLSSLELYLYMVLQPFQDLDFVPLVSSKFFADNKSINKTSVLFFWRSKSLNTWNCCWGIYMVWHFQHTLGVFSYNKYGMMHIMDERMNEHSTRMRTNLSMRLWTISWFWLDLKWDRILALQTFSFF